MTGPSGLSRQLVRTRTNKQMTSPVVVLRGGPGTLNLTTRKLTGMTDAATQFSGKARIRTINGGGTITVGGAEIDTRRTTISIPIDALMPDGVTLAMPRRDDLVVATSINPDPDGSVADGATFYAAFRVLEVDGGGYFGDARRMTCIQFFGSAVWAGTQ